MEISEFLAFIAIVLGLGLTRLLDSIGKALEHRDEISHFWLLYFWAASAFAGMMQIWWGMWEWQDRIPTDIFSGMVIVSIAAAWFMLAEALFPDDLDRFKKKFKSDQELWYFANKKYLFSLAISIMILTGLNEFFVLDEKSFNSRYAIRLILCGIYAFLAFEKIQNRRIKISLHFLGSCLNIAALIGFIEVTAPGEN